MKEIPLKIDRKKKIYREIFCKKLSVWSKNVKSRPTSLILKIFGQLSNLLKMSNPL